MKRSEWRVLIIDDNPEDRAEMRRLLLSGSARRYRFDEVETGRAAIAACRDRVHDPYACLLLDFRLPDCEAPEVLAALGGERPRHPIVVVTGGARIDSRALLRAGAQDFIGKSWMNPESLTRTVENAVERFALTAGLRASEERLRLFVEHAPAAVAMLDPNLRYLAASRRWREDYRLQGELIGRSHYDTFPDIPERWRRVHAHALAGEVVTASEDRFERANGEVQWLHWEVRPWHDADGAVGGIMIFSEDITARRMAEEALRRRAEEIERLLEVVPVAVWVAHDPACRHIVGNRRANELYEAAPGDNVSASASPETRRYFASDGRELAAEELPMQAAAAGNRELSDVELEVALPSGRRLSLFGGAVPLRDEAGAVRGGIGAFMDISERKRAEAALKASEERFRAVFEHARLGIAITDWRGCLEQCNPAFCELLGYGGEELARIDFADLIHPEDRAANLAQIQGLRDGEMTSFEIENRYLRKDGTPLWVRKFVSLLRDGRGRPAHLLALITDISERRAMVEALREADRRKDEFLAMLAHELRNPLAPIANAVHVLRRPGLDAARSAWCREVIERQTLQLTRLVDDLLDVSRITRGIIELRREEVDVAEIVRRAVETSRPLIDARRHVLTVAPPGESLFVQGDPVRLAQILANLLNNAAKYTDEGGQIRLGVERQGGDVVIRVRDNGRGMEASLLSRAFDLFYQADRTLDRAEGGLGIGLSLVKRLVDLHGGQVRAHSEGRGRGSEFVVRLPCLDGRVARELPRPARSAAEPGGVRVLVVDDNPDAAESLRLLLEGEGYRIGLAHDGPGGVAKALAERPAAVLLDIGLPGCDGYEACRRMRAGGLGGALIVALTGCGQDEDRRRALEAGFDAHLVKPVAFEDLEPLLAGLERGPTEVRARGAG